jgi:hypothetical protein
MDARVEATQEQLPDADSFSPAHGGAGERPALAHGLAGQESGKRQAGCRFLLAISILDKH